MLLNQAKLIKNGIKDMHVEKTKYDRSISLFDHLIAYFSRSNSKSSSISKRSSVRKSDVSWVLWKGKIIGKKGKETSMQMQRSMFLQSQFCLLFDWYVFFYLISSLLFRCFISGLIGTFSNEPWIFTLQGVRFFVVEMNEFINLAIQTSRMPNLLWWM